MTFRWHFTAEPLAVGQARRCLEDTLADEPAGLIQVASLLVSELATNAVCHARTEFDVDLTLGSGYVGIKVSDTGPGDPVVQVPAPMDGNGRGLQIVELLADEWGVVRDSERRKAVWCTLTLDRFGGEAGHRLRALDDGAPAACR